jgi:hypothetical protein
VVAVIQLLNKMDGSEPSALGFDKDDEKLLQAFASFAGIAITNAQMYTRQNELTNNANNVVHITKKLSSCKTLDELEESLVDLLPVEFNKVGEVKFYKAYRGSIHFVATLVDGSKEKMPTDEGSSLARLLDPAADGVETPNLNPRRKSARRSSALFSGEKLFASASSADGMRILSDAHSIAIGFGTADSVMWYGGRACEYSHNGRRRRHQRHKDTSARTPDAVYIYSSFIRCRGVFYVQAEDNENFSSDDHLALRQVCSQVLAAVANALIRANVTPMRPNLARCSQVVTSATNLKLQSEMSEMHSFLQDVMGAIPSHVIVLDSSRAVINCNRDLTVAFAIEKADFGADIGTGRTCARTRHNAPVLRLPRAVVSVVRIAALWHGMRVLLWQWSGSRRSRSQGSYRRRCRRRMSQMERRHTCPARARKRPPAATARSRMNRRWHSSSPRRCSSRIASCCAVTGASCTWT